MKNFSNKIGRILFLVFIVVVFIGLEVWQRNHDPSCSCLAGRYYERAD